MLVLLASSLSLSCIIAFLAMWVHMQWNQPFEYSFTGQKCEALLQPENGAKSCTIGEYVSSKCTFSCDHGYRLSEDFSNPAVCTDDGLFTEESPTCESRIDTDSPFAFIQRVNELFGSLRPLR